MFTQNHIKEIKKISDNHISKMILKRAKTLENAYKENPFVEKAEVSVEGETVNIDIKLNLQLKNDEQNIPGILEYGGVIIDAKDKIHNIEPGFYMRRIMAYGLPK